MAEQELAADELPCPFCGSDDQTVVDFSCSERGDGYIIQCDRCGAQGPFGAKEDAANKLWDTQRPPPKHAAAAHDALDALRMVVAYFWEPTPEDGKVWREQDVQAFVEAAVKGLKAVGAPAAGEQQMRLIT